MRTIVIPQPKSHAIEDTTIVKLPCGSQVKVSSFYSHFYNSLLDMTDQEKIEFMKISPDGLHDYVADRQKRMVEELKEALCKNWYWAETGEPVDVKTNFSYTLPSIEKMLAKLRSKHKPNLDILCAWLQFFETRSNVYTKNEAHER